MKKVLLGMSGGVDSSTSAILLQKEGYEVVGCTMRLFNCNNGIDQNSIDAKKVCDKLGIVHYTFDFSSDFDKYVISNFIDTYSKGKTPNPCIECNKYLKFKAMYEKAKELNCEYIATGHYADVMFSEKFNKNVLIKSQNEKKDQSYFLYNIDKKIVDKLIFPLAKFTSKDEIRKIAAEHSLEVASKPDSEDICFIPEGNYIDFLTKKGVKLKQGNFIEKDGKVIKRHEGIERYTVGQRKGLGISRQTPSYVVGFKNNDVIIGEEKDIYLKEVKVQNINYLIEDLDKPLEVMAKIRYASKASKAVIYPKDNNEALVVFEELQRAVTPGQAIVFYIDENIVFGGGKIV